jgi:spore maturation protein CgeB
MRVVMFYHSLVSDWNHGNAHFLRGVVQELIDRGHDVQVLEPRDGWSRSNLLQDHGAAAIGAFERAYPRLRSAFYDAATLDLDRVLSGADLVLVHEWNDHDLVARLGRHHAAHGGYRLLFHDTHHRSVTDPSSMAAYDLRHYDGVLAFGDTIRDLYLSRGWTTRAWTWHEAADTRVFFPRSALTAEHAEHAENNLYKTDSAISASSAVRHGVREGSGDVVWIGNWGDEERTAELDEFLLQPVRALGLRASVYGVRYPAEARERLAAAGIAYRGWLPNADVPDVFARHTITVHIPRRPYLESLPGVPTIRPFEALACGIPLVCARWDQTADLFTPGRDFLVARSGAEMTGHLARLLADPGERRTLAAHGLATVTARHTCAHRVDELIAIDDEIAMEVATP